MIFTLLQMTQDVLSSLGSDEINSIGDTVEAQQVATIIKNKYFDIIARGDLKEHSQLIQLGASTDSTLPVLMYVPSGITNIQWVKYYDSNPANNSNMQSGQFGAFSKHGVNTDLEENAGITFTTTSISTNTIQTGPSTWILAGNIPNTQIPIGSTITFTNGHNSESGLVTSYNNPTLIANITTTIGAGTFSTWNVTGGITATSVPGYKYVTVIPTDQFIDYVNRFNPTDSNVLPYNFSDISNRMPYDFTFSLLYKNDNQPQWCTVINNTYVLFDSYDNTQDSTLQSSKTMVMAQVLPTFQMVDSFIPDLDDNRFPLLLNEAKAMAFYELKQQPHLLADRELKRQWTVTQKTRSVENRPNYFDQLPNMGRVPRTGGYASGGYGAYKWMRGGGGI